MSDQQSDKSSSGRCWLITGASSGLGLAFTQAALKAGDRVVTFSRRTEPLQVLVDDYGSQLLVLKVDVTDREAVLAGVKQAHQHFGRLDIIVNNAGQLFLGMVEEFSEADARAQMEINFFGALWVSQAVAPLLRAQKAGHLVQISSIGALGGYPQTGLYSASKWALEGLSEALALELAPFGVKLTLVEPGGYWTGLYQQMQISEPLEAYSDLRAEIEKQWSTGSVDSDPILAAEAVMKLVNSDDPPLRLLLGSLVYDLAQASTRQRLATWAAWEDVSRAAEYGIPDPGLGRQQPG